MYIVFHSEDLRLTCKFVENKSKIGGFGPRFLGGGNTPYFGHAFLNRTHFQTYGQFWLNSVHWAHWVADGM